MRSDNFPGIPAHQRAEWFHERYQLAAGQTIEFLSREFISLGGLDVVDIGCGDGIIDLGLVGRAGPASLVGFDIRPTDTGLLKELAAENGLTPELPAGLEFRTAQPRRLPAPDASFDLAVSWSAFHHMVHPQQMAHEIRRVLRPGGLLMVQIYPFFHSRHGSLLEPWFPDGWAQFLHEPDELARMVRENPGPDPQWAEAMLDANRNLNRLTLDELDRVLQLAGFRVRRIYLIGDECDIPPEVARLGLSRLGTAGVMLLAEAGPG